LSRISGLIRDRIFAHYFGNSDAADAFKAALRIPNVLQNLFGEGVLSASFIPVYAALLAREDQEEADRTAGAVLSLLALTASVLVLVGVLTTPWLIELIAPGFHGEKRELTIRLVQILFPGVGLLVLSAWCLGILNSHRKFFLSYTAPVVWNGAIIAALVGFGPRMAQFPLAAVTAWGAVAGSALMVGVQWPVVIRLLGRLRLSLDYQAANVATVIRNFFPVFISRGVVQISAYVDAFLASLLPTGAVAALSYAQTLYTLPVSLFGMAVAAAELPVMSGQLGGDEEVARVLQARLNAGLVTKKSPECCRRGSTRGCGRLPIWWCRQWWPFWRSAMSLSAPSTRRGNSGTRMPSTCGEFWPAQRSACSLPRWDASIPLPTTLCATRARRCGSPLCALH